jgi:hypothetical protein
MKLLFNLPVHENNEIIENVIQNINKFVNAPIILIHVNKNWDGFDYSIVDKYDNVYINPTRISLIKYHNSLPIFISNFKYAQQFDYDYFCIFHSNELFIKPGIEQYIKDNDISHQHFVNIKHQNTVNTINNTDFLNKIPSHEIFNNHVEGNFYKREIMQEIIKCLEQDYPVMIDFIGSVEETLIPTLAYKFCDKNKIVPTYMLSFYCKQYSMTIEHIMELLYPNLIVEGFYNIPVNTNTIFTVKPVNRDINDPVRIYINNL